MRGRRLSGATLVDALHEYAQELRRRQTLSPGDYRVVLGMCCKLRDVRAGEPVVCGVEGIRVVPEFRERDRLGFAFMTNDISSERRVEITAAKVAAMLKDVRAAHGRR